MFDANGDGRVTPGEWRHGLGDLSPQRRAAARCVFNRFAVQRQPAAVAAAAPAAAAAAAVEAVAGGSYVDESGFESALKMLGGALLSSGGAASGCSFMQL